MKSYKLEYNELLKRYYNGCEYLKENPKESEKYLDLLLNILNKINKILIENNITDTNIILNGFIL